MNRQELSCERLANKELEREFTELESKLAELSVKNCVKCGELKPLLNFSSNVRAKDGLNQYCRQCEKLRQQAYRAKPKTCAYCASEPLPGAHFCSSCQEKYSNAFSQARESGASTKEANKYALASLK